MGLIVIALFLAHLVSGLTFYGANIPFAPTLLVRMQTQNSNVDWTAFGKNYTGAVLTGSTALTDVWGCELSSYGAGKKSEIVFVQVSSTPCDIAYAQRNPQDAGYGASIAINSVTVNGLRWSTIGPYPFGIPFVFPNQQSVTTTWGTLEAPAAIAAKAISKGTNITVFLDFPSQNYIEASFFDYWGGMYNTRWFGFAIACLGLCFCSAKLGMFFTFSGFSLNIPTMVLGSVLLANVFVILNIIVGVEGFYETASWRGAFFFNWWPWSWILTANIIMGLYFADVALLTSSAGAAGTMKVMKIPMIVILVILWAAQITISFISIFPPTSNGAAQGGTFSNFFIAIVALVNFVTLALNTWGTILLARAVSSLSGVQRSSVITTFVLADLSCLISVTFSLWYYAFRFFSPQTGVNLSLTQFFTILGALIWIPIPISGLLLSFLFQVSVSKEVELSKSGTSSTSMHSSSSKSSSSSSSSSDPVIEL